MRKPPNVSVIGLVITIALILQGCSLPGMSQGDGITAEDLQFTQVAMTVMAMQAADQGDAAGGDENTQDQVAQDPDVQAPTSTQTLMPSSTLTPTITLTPTQDKPMVSISTDTNCRTGPGKIYDYIGALLVGEMAEVVGQSMDGQYWIIKNPDQNGECWLWGQYASVSGATTGLPKYTPPPTPTPVFVWTGTWTTYNGPNGGPYDVFTINLTMTAHTLSGTILEGGNWVADLNGTVKDDLLSAYGNWASGTSSGTFEFFAYGANQFQGNGVNNNDPGFVYDWCGGRNGAGQPSPCLKN
jgi:hypothetical protein